MASNTDYKTTIKIEGDSKGAEAAVSRTGGALGNLGKSIQNISRRIGSALSAFSKLTWIVQSVQLVIDGFKKLYEWMGRAERAAREFADAQERAALAAQSALSAHAYKELNKELEEANRLERQRNDILNQRKAISRDLEDAHVAIAREQEIAALDPNSQTYAQDKAAIEKKYAAQESETTMHRATENNRDEIARLYREAERLEKQASQKEAAYNRQQSVVDRGVERAFRLDREAKAIDEDDEDEKKAAQDKAKEAENQWRSDLKVAQEIKASMEALRNEAAALRDKAANMPGGVAERIKHEARLLQLDNKEREQKAAADKKLQEKDAEQKRDVEQFAGTLAAKAADRAWDKEYDEADSTRKLTMLRDKEATAAADLQALRTQLKEEMAKDVRDRDSRRIADLKSGISDAQDRVYSAQDEAERLAKEEVKDRNAMMGAMVSAAAPSGNRLTAMGLGAGSGVDRLQTQMADSLKHLVALSQQQISELRGIKEESLVATYGD